MDRDHILDRAVWHALTGRQSVFARGGELAKGFDTEVAAFIETIDDSAGSLAALAELVPLDSFSYWLTDGNKAPPPGTFIEKSRVAVQMVANAFTPVEKNAQIVLLGMADVPEMIALTALTEPGPFYARTHEMAQFWGIKRDGRLAAMAGERLKPGHYTEVSAVCTHPDFRGLGYAAELSKWVASLIVGRGEIPFLHSYADNDGAVRLYEKLGFVIRAEIHANILRLT